MVMSIELSQSCFVAAEFTDLDNEVSTFDSS